MKKQSELSDNRISVTSYVFFVRPMPDENCQDRMVYLVIAKDEKECWQLIGEEYHQSPNEQNKKGYFIAEKIEMKETSESRLIWGVSKVGVGK